jgi:drug/metabolite transporter (DMT)-like permease
MMEWMAPLLLATFLSGLGNALHRRIAEKEDVQSYSFLFTLIAGALFVPLMFTEPLVLPQGIGWAVFFLAAFFWFVANITAFTAAKHAEASLIAPLNNVKVVLLLFLSMVLLQEALTLPKLAGTLLVFAGAFILTWGPGKFGNLKDPGVQFTLFNALFIAMVTILDKANIMLGVSRNFYGACMYLVPCVFHAMRLKGRKSHLKKIVKNKGREVLAVGVTYFLLYYLYLVVYSFPEAEISIVYPIGRLNILVTVFLGFVWLGEKKDVGKRLLASLLMIAGAVLVTL